MTAFRGSHLPGHFGLYSEFLPPLCRNEKVELQILFREDRLPNSKSKLAQNSQQHSIL
jgi:hypothetical protein